MPAIPITGHRATEDRKPSPLLITPAREEMARLSR